MILLPLFFAVALGMAHHLGYVPLPLLLLYGVMSLLGFILYGVDKQAAMNGTRRIPERRLHLVTLLGGWPGTMLAQPLFNHKWRKRRFQQIFWLMSMLNAGLLAVWLTV